jgi:alanine racemase
MISYIELNQSHLLHNYQQFRQLLPPDMKIMSVVKGNAYGHGLHQVANILDQISDCFGIITLNDLITLRTSTNKPAYLLGYSGNTELEAIVQHEGIPVIYNKDQLTLLDQIGKKYQKRVLFNIKIDSFLGRQGILLEEIESFIRLLKPYQNIRLLGIYSHFANIEDTSDFSHAQKQIDGFQHAKQLFIKAGYNDIETHISSTAGTLVYEHNHGKNTLVRVGIGSYGLWPSSQIKEQGLVDLQPVLRWISHIAQVKMVPKNYSIGYGLTYITDKPTKIAVIPQGYADGYDRGLSNKGEVLIQGTRCRVLGRVSMNMFVVDVSHLNIVSAEDEVVLLGTQGNEAITAEDIADKIDTINYEVVTRISPLLPRKIV